MITITFWKWPEETPNLANFIQTFLANILVSKRMKLNNIQQLLLFGNVFHN